MLESINGFHIEPTNLCTLKCPGCARTRFINQWPTHWRNHSLDIDVLLKFLDLDLTGKHVNLCGNYGDPIYHPEFIEFVQQLKQRGAIIEIHTNGSYRTQEWWEKLVTVLTAQDTVIFSVDGLPENFTTYRINADWESISTGMKVVADSSCHSVWKYIVFSFNQHNIDSAKELGASLGIKEFKTQLSNRFDEHTQHLMPTEEFLDSHYKSQVTWKLGQRNKKVNPGCNDGWSHFITADGHYSPCCWLADHRFYYKTPFGKNKKMYDIKQQTFSKILQQPKTVEFYQTLEEQPGCQYNCPNAAG
jgi:pyruvate-formate lyase-activating enzyme